MRTETPINPTIERAIIAQSGKGFPSLGSGIGYSLSYTYFPQKYIFLLSKSMWVSLFYRKKIPFNTKISSKSFKPDSV
jgi:hypothetical protein